ncbi:MAG: phage tail tip lysozyme [Acetobacter orientalis]|uniref:phage tail tip lysozyme n=1 Tax=Acetobacter orientalis TaxID=146474 RepID=UPI0039E96885
MAAAVKIKIDAVEFVTGKLDKISNKLAAIQAPLRNASKSLNRFFAVSGLSSMRKGMADLSRATLGAFQSVGRLVPEMGALTGAASIAGVYRLASAWARVGTNLRTSARSMGMNPRRLMALQNAARLSGGSADAMSGALSQLSTQKWEAVNGFAPEAAAQFQALGISMEEVKKLSPEQLFGRIATKIRGIKDPAAQTIAALKLFGDAGKGLLPIFQQSGKEFQDNIKLAERYGVMNKKGADAAGRLQNAQTQLTLAVEGFGYSIAEAVEPAITPIVQQMAEWIAANRDWISQDIAGKVKQLVQWLKDGGWEKIHDTIMDIGNRISEVVDKLGGWKSAAKDAAIGLMVIGGAPVLTTLLNLTSSLLGVVGAMKTITGLGAGVQTVLAMTAGYYANKGLKALDPQDKMGAWVDKYIPGASFLDNAASYLGFGRSYEEQKRVQGILDQASASQKSAAVGAQKFFMGSGYTGQQAAGLVANLMQENQEFDPAKVGDHGTAYGLAQWHKDRQDDFKRVMGHDIHGSSREEQLRFMKWELDNQSYLGGDGIKHASNAAQAAALASVNFFRPGLTPSDQMAEMRNRAGMGADWYSEFSKMPDSAPPATIQPPVTKGGSNTLGGTTDRLRVEISHDNAPPGSSVKVTSASPGIKVASVTQRAMDPANTAIGN